LTRNPTKSRIYSTSIFLTSGVSYFVSAAGQIELPGVPATEDYAKLALGGGASDQPNQAVMGDFQFRPTYLRTGQFVIDWSLTGIYTGTADNQLFQLRVDCYSAIAGDIKIFVRTMMATQVRIQTS